MGGRRSDKAQGVPQQPFLFRQLKCLKLGHQSWQVMANRDPQDVQVDIEIGMHQPIARDP